MAPVVTIFALWFLAASLILGQTIRFPLPGQSGGLLVSDVAVVLVLVAALGHFIFQPRSRPPSSKLLTTHYSLLTIPFITWSAFTLLLRGGDYSSGELFIAAAYWLRTSAYLLLLPALVYIAPEDRIYQTLHRSFVTTTLALVVVGLGQYMWLPHLNDLPAALVSTSGGGWDPHEGRLVSTWLDPNFFGAYLAISLLYSLASLLSATTRSSRTFFIIVSVAIVVAGILTQSRSSTLALALTFVVVSPFLLARLAKKTTPALVPVILAAVSLGSIALLVAGVTLGDRLLGLFTFDATVQQRAAALAATWQVATDHPFAGVGYNAWQFAAQEAGLIKDFSAHSRAGADNSWLTLLVTTGFIGLTLFVLPWVVVAHQLLARWLRKGQPLAVASFAALLFLTIHAQFVNSWLYGHLLITISIVVALALTHSSSHEKSLLQ